MPMLTLSGREVVAFVEHSEYGSNWITAIKPIPKDGATGYAFNESSSGSINIWGTESRRGKRIAAAYRAGELGSGVSVERLNRILRPDEFAESEVTSA